MGKKIEHTGGVQYTTTQDVEVVKGCNAIIITNLGDTIVKVDEITLFPNASPSTAAGDTVTFGGHEGDLWNKKKIRVRFNNPLGANPLIEIDQIYYPNEC